MAIYFGILSLITLAAILAAVYFYNIVARQQRDLVQLKREFRAISDNFAALCKSGAGMDQRICGLEQRERDQREKMESVEAQRQSDSPYGEAIYMAHQGASAQRLVEELGLSMHEAELLCQVHGVKPAA